MAVTIGKYRIECERARTRSGYHIAYVWVGGFINYIAMEPSERAAFHKAQAYALRNEVLQ